MKRLVSVIKIPILFFTATTASLLGFFGAGKSDVANLFDDGLKLGTPAFADHTTSSVDCTQCSYTCGNSESAGAGSSGCDGGGAGSDGGGSGGGDGCCGP